MTGHLEPLSPEFVAKGVVEGGRNLCANKYTIMDNEAFREKFWFTKMS